MTHSVLRNGRTGKGCGGYTRKLGEFVGGRFRVVQKAGEGRGLEVARTGLCINCVSLALPICLTGSASKTSLSSEKMPLRWRIIENCVRDFSVSEQQAERLRCSFGGGGDDLAARPRRRRRRPAPRPPSEPPRWRSAWSRRRCQRQAARPAEPVFERH